MSYLNSFSKAPRMMLVLSLMVSLALLALACQPAAQPTAAPTAAAPMVAPPTATALAGANLLPIEVPTTGKYIERAGVRLFIPEGNEFGGPTIPPDPRAPRYGGVAVSGQAGDAPSLDPYHTTGTYAQAPTALFYERLVHYPTEPGTDSFAETIIPGLAESWDISKDFLTYTFHLRKGVKWHNLPPVNGREMDAEDVKFTWDLFMSKGSVEAGFFTNVDRGEVVDRYTAVLHMKQVDPGMLGVLSDIMRGYVLPRESATFSRLLTGIGTGPFMVQKGKDWEYKVGITFQRNPDYWVFDQRGNRLPYVDFYRIFVMPDATARLTAFRTGKIDTGASVVNASELRNLLKTNPTTLIQERKAFAASASTVAFHLDKAPWNDVRVRRAMSLALDYKTIGQTIFEVSPTLSGVMIPAWYGETDASAEILTRECGCPWYTYDPKRAKELLAEAGFPSGFPTTLVYFSYSAIDTQTFELYQAYWKAIGMDVKILSQDYTVFRGNIDRGGWAEMTHTFQFPSPSTPYGAASAFLPGQGQTPAMGFPNDPKLTALTNAVLASYDKDQATRWKVAGQWRAYYLDQVFLLPRVSGNSYSILAPRLRNFQPAVSIGTEHRHRMHIWIDDEWAFTK